MSLLIRGWFLLMLAAPAAAQAQPAATIHEFTLDNGLKLVVKEDHRAPVAIAQVWYKVGSATEYSGSTGISHVLEHMMFKGTRKYPPGRFAALISANGGQQNAFTSRDYTAYYEVLAAERLPISLELEADRMEGLLFDEKAFHKELAVVMEERRLRTEDSPNALAYEQLFAAAFDNAPYHHPVIGWMEDLRNLKREDVRQWYLSWYAPNNAILVVVGDVDPKAVHRLAEQTFGKVHRRPVPTQKPRLEPPQLGPKRVTVRAPAELPYVAFGYKVPVYGKAEHPWEPYALEVVAAILDGGSSSRLSKDLIRDREIAASAGASYGIYAGHDSLLLLDGIPAVGHSIEDVETALLEEVERLRTGPVSAAELERVKAQVVAEDVYRKDSVSRQANLIGMVESLGLGWQVLDRYIAGIQAITAEQVQAVARKYLNSDSRTSATVQPQPLATQAPRILPSLARVTGHE